MNRFYSTSPVSITWSSVPTARFSVSCPNGCLRLLQSAILDELTKLFFCTIDFHQSTTRCSTTIMLAGPFTFHPLVLVCSSSSSVKKFPHICAFGHNPHLLLLGLVVRLGRNALTAGSLDAKRGDTIPVNNNDSGRLPGARGSVLTTTMNVRLAVEGASTGLISGQRRGFGWNASHAHVLAVHYDRRRFVVG